LPWQSIAQKITGKRETELESLEEPLTPRISLLTVNTYIIYYKILFVKRLADIPVCPYENKRLDFIGFSTIDSKKFLSKF